MFNRMKKPSNFSQSQAHDSSPARDLGCNSTLLWLIFYPGARNRPSSKATPTLNCCAKPRRSLMRDRKSTRLNSSHGYISYAVFCLKKKKTTHPHHTQQHTLTD